jgi:hypothetical protein
MGYAPVLSHCCLSRNPGLKPTHVLEHCDEGEITVGSPFLGDVNVHFLIYSSNSFKLYQRIPVQCTSEFRELFEAASMSLIPLFALRARTCKNIIFYHHMFCH